MTRLDFQVYRLWIQCKEEDNTINYQDCTSGEHSPCACIAQDKGTTLSCEDSVRHPTAEILAKQVGSKYIRIMNKYYIVFSNRKH